MFGIGFGAAASSLVSAATPSFKTFGYTGTGASQSFTAPGFQPDLVLIFNTAGNSSGTWLGFDSKNGVENYFAWEWSAGLSGFGSNTLTAFNSNGFTVGSSALVNNNGTGYQAFCWKKSANFFDIESYTGNGTAGTTISHNLTSVPNMIALFDNGTAGTEEIGNLIFGTGTMAASSPWGDYMPQGTSLATTACTATGSGAVWDSTAPTSSGFTLGTGGLSNSQDTNKNANAYTGYLWGTTSGYSAFGTYTGNGSGSGPTVSGLGFTPSLVMILEQSCSGNNWRVVYGNTASGELNTQNAKSTNNFINLVSGGFNVVTTNADFNSNGADYQYMAWA